MGRVSSIGFETADAQEVRPGHYGGFRTPSRKETDKRAWLDDALCAEIDQDAFFPGKGESHKILKQVCGECAVRNQCLEDALRTGDVYDGVRGGLGPVSRRRLMRERRMAR